MIATNRETKDVNLSNATISVKMTNFAFVCILSVECKCGTHPFSMEPRQRNDMTLGNIPSMAEKKKRDTQNLQEM